MNVQGEGRSGRSNNGKTASPDDGRQGGEDREHRRLCPLREGLNDDRRLAATGAGQPAEFPPDAGSVEADRAASRIAALLSRSATILSFPKVG